MKFGISVNCINLLNWGYAIGIIHIEFSNNLILLILSIAILIVISINIFTVKKIVINISNKISHLDKKVLSLAKYMFAIKVILWVMSLILVHTCKSGTVFFCLVSIIMITEACLIFFYLFQPESPLSGMFKSVIGVAISYSITTITLLYIQTFSLFILTMISIILFQIVVYLTHTNRIQKKVLHFLNNIVVSNVFCVGLIVLAVHMSVAFLSTLVDFEFLNSFMSLPLPLQICGDTAGVVGSGTVTRFLMNNIPRGFSSGGKSYINNGVRGSFGGFSGTTKPNLIPYNPKLIYESNRNYIEVLRMKNKEFCEKNFPKKSVYNHFWARDTETNVTNTLTSSPKNNILISEENVKGDPEKQYMHSEPFTSTPEFIKENLKTTQQTENYGWKYQKELSKAQQDLVILHGSKEINSADIEYNKKLGSIKKK